MIDCLSPFTEELMLLVILQYSSIIIRKDYMRPDMESY
jgi:hypothetical protein